MGYDITQEEYHNVVYNRLLVKFKKYKNECNRIFETLLLNDKIHLEDFSYEMRTQNTDYYILALRCARNISCQSLVSALKIYQDDLLRIKTEKTLSEYEYDYIRDIFVTDLNFYDKGWFCDCEEYKKFRKAVPKELFVRNF